MKVFSERTFPEMAFIEALEQSVKHVFGEVGLSKLNLRFIVLDPSTRRAIVRCNHANIQELRFAVSLVRTIAGESCVIFSERVSGTLKSLGQLLGARAKEPSSQNLILRNFAGE